MRKVCRSMQSKMITQGSHKGGYEYAKGGQRYAKGVSQYATTSGLLKNQP